MKKIKYIFCHGFGFSPQFWKPLLNFFHPDEIVNYDLGYFSDATSLTLEFNQKEYDYIGIGHSLGFHKLVTGYFDINFKSIIGINAFSNFLGESSLLYKKRKYEYKMFQNQFLENPIPTLKNFHRRCGLNYDDFDIPAKLNLKKLNNDLEILASPINVNSDKNVLIINSSDDVIIPLEISHDNFHNLSNTKMIIMEKGRHVLGYYNPQIIYKTIKDFLK